MPQNVPPQALVGRPLLTQSILSQGAKQHHSVQLEITLQAPTNIINLSQTPPPLAFPAGLKVYAESGPRRLVEGATDGSTTISYRYFIMPLEAGSFQLPNIHIPYFDPELGVMNGALLQGQRLEVAPAAIPNKEDSLPSPATTQTSTTTVPNEQALPWQIATLILILLWLGTLLMLRRQKREDRVTATGHNKAAVADTTVRHPLQQQLLTALGTRTLEQGLIQWETKYGVDDEIRDVIQQVQQCCYGPQQDQNIDHLQETATKIISKMQKKKTTVYISDTWSPKAFTAR